MSLVGTEELAHWEMLGAMLTQSLCGASDAELEEAGMTCWYANHGNGAYPADCAGNPWRAEYVSVTGDPIADMTNNMAAEEKARAGYEAVLRLTDDPEYVAPLQFLRMREVVHYQRFGEALMRLYAKGYGKKRGCTEKTVTVTTTTDCGCDK